MIALRRLMDFAAFACFYRIISVPAASSPVISERVTVTFTVSVLEPFFKVIPETVVGESINKPVGIPGPVIIASAFSRIAPALALSIPIALVVARPVGIVS